MKTLICCGEDYMPRRYQLTEPGELILTDEGESLCTVYDTKDVCVLGGIGDTVQARTIAEVLGRLTMHTVDNHVWAMNAAVRRISRWLNVDTTRALNIEVDAGAGSGKTLTILDMDYGWYFVNDDNFDDADCARQWAKRYVEALEELGIKVNVKWKTMRRL